MSFNLLDEPWIQCETTSHGLTQVSIRDVFRDSSTLARVRGDSPAQNYAVLRLLLAIFWRAHHTDAIVQAGDTFAFDEWFEDQWEALENNASDPQVLAYLDQYEDRFDLLHESTPFMQVADLHTTNGEIKSVSTLLPETAPLPFTMRDGASIESLSLSEAARWLLYLQAFDCSGIKSGAIGDNRVKGGRGYPIGTGWSGMTGATIVHGENLLKTLLFNTTAECLGNLLDKAVWERPQDTSAVRSNLQDVDGNAVPGVPQGPADLAVWQARRIRLFLEEGKVTGVILSNGDQIPDAGANELSDPMTPYRYSANKSKRDHDVYYPRPYDPERTVWRSLDALVVGSLDTPADPKSRLPKKANTLSSLAQLSASGLDFIPEILDVELVSVVYGPQSATLASAVHAMLTLPTSLIHEDAVDAREAVRVASAATLEAAIELGRFAKNLLVAAGSSVKETPFPAAVVDSALAELEPQFKNWLGHLTEVSDDFTAIDKAVNVWERQARDLLEAHAREQLRGAGPRALIGRVLNEESGRTVSAGTLHRSFLRHLNERFPSTAPATNSPTIPESEVNNGPE